MNSRRTVFLFCSLVAFATITVHGNAEAAPPNDDCASAIVIAAMPFSEPGLDTSTATSEVSDPLNGCSGTFGGGTVWYSFTPPSDGTLSLATLGSDFDTILAVHSGACGATVEEACDDDDSPLLTSSIDVAVTGGTAYLIEAGGFDEFEYGTLVLEATFTAAVVGPENDECEDATIVGALPYTDSGQDTTSATSDPSDPAFCGSDPDRPTVWYSYTPTESGALFITTAGSDYDTVLGVLTGSCGSLSNLACDDDGNVDLTSSLTVWVTAGTTYLIPVAGYDAATFGDLTLHLELVTTTCSPTPRSYCDGAPKTKFAFTDAGEKSKLSWKWANFSGGMSQSGFGSPLTGGTDYFFCVYNVVDSVWVLNLAAEIPEAGTCDGKPCWKDVSGKGWSYGNKAGTADGIVKLQMKGGDPGKPQIKVSAKGAAIPLPAPVSGTQFFATGDSVKVQLQNNTNGNCWAKTYDADTAKLNEATRFSIQTQ